MARIYESLENTIRKAPKVALQEANDRYMHKYPSAPAHVKAVADTMNDLKGLSDKELRDKASSIAQARYAAKTEKTRFGLMNAIRTAVHGKKAVSDFDDHFFSDDNHPKTQASYRKVNESLDLIATKAINEAEEMKDALHLRLAMKFLQAHFDTKYDPLKGGSGLISAMDNGDVAKHKERMSDLSDEHHRMTGKHYDPYGGIQDHKPIF